MSPSREAGSNSDAVGSSRLRRSLSRHASSNIRAPAKAMASTVAMKPKVETPDRNPLWSSLMSEAS